ncbi:hypothetical protein C8Q72DRAFT_830510 [Fomitopsis betulina]|nr:hypothetical protein C8Q72DRAFT_830510 [Fomitopsis betulina]
MRRLASQWSILLETCCLEPCVSFDCQRLEGARWVRYGPHECQNQCNDIREGLLQGSGPCRTSSCSLARPLRHAVTASASAAIELFPGKCVLWPDAMKALRASVLPDQRASRVHIQQSVMLVSVTTFNSTSLPRMPGRPVTDSVLTPRLKAALVALSASLDATHYKNSTDALMTV